MIAVRVGREKAAQVDASTKSCKGVGILSHLRFRRTASLNDTFDIGTGKISSREDSPTDSSIRQGYYVAQNIGSPEVVA